MFSQSCCFTIGWILGLPLFTWSFQPSSEDIFNCFNVRKTIPRLRQLSMAASSVKLMLLWLEFLIPSLKSLYGMYITIPAYPSSVFEASVKPRRFLRRYSIPSSATSILKGSPLTKERFDLSNFGSCFVQPFLVCSFLKIFDKVSRNKRFDCF